MFLVAIRESDIFAEACAAIPAWLRLKPFYLMLYIDCMLSSSCLKTGSLQSPFSISSRNPCSAPLRIYR